MPAGQDPANQLIVKLFLKFLKLLKWLRCYSKIANASTGILILLISSIEISIHFIYSITTESHKPAPFTVPAGNINPFYYF